MQFRYEAYTLKDGVTKGLIEASNQGEAVAAVRYQGYKPLRVSPVRQLPRLETFFPSLFQVKKAELVRFSRQLATMLNSGAGLLRTLQILQEQSSGGAMRKVLADILQTLKEGGSFSTAMTKNPTVFSPLFVSVAEVGEYTGQLGPALEQLADILEKEQEAKQKVIQTLMYPLAIITLSLVTLVILMTVALPPLMTVFAQMGTELPLITRIALGMLNGVKSSVLYISVGFAAFIIIYSLLRRIPQVSYWLDTAMVRSPLFGPMIISGELSRFSRTLSMLLESGVSLAATLHLAISGCKNQALRRRFSDAEESLLSGHRLTDALKNHSMIPSMFVELVMTGEESNSLQRTMNDAAKAYQKQLEQRLNRMLGMLEPASTVVVGAIVGFIAFSMFVPIYAGLNAIP